MPRPEIGRDVGRAQMHAHHAIQIALAMTGSFLMHDEHDAEDSPRRGTVVMPHRRHQFDGCGHAVAVLFVEPETRQGRALFARHRDSDVAALPTTSPPRRRPVSPIPPTSAAPVGA